MSLVENSFALNSETKMPPKRGPIKMITRHRHSDDRFYVWWQGFPASEGTWEPRGSLPAAAIADFRRHSAKKSKSKGRLVGRPGEKKGARPKPSASPAPKRPAASAQRRRRHSSVEGGILLAEAVKGAELAGDVLDSRRESLEALPSQKGRVGSWWVESREVGGGGKYNPEKLGG